MGEQLKQLARIKDHNLMFGVSLYNFEGQPVQVPINNVNALVLEESLWTMNIPDI